MFFQDSGYFQITATWRFLFTVAKYSEMGGQNGIAVCGFLLSQGSYEPHLFWNCC